MARAVVFDPKRHTAYEPLYDMDPQTGARVEIFYADRTPLATSSVQGGSGGRASPVFCQGTCQLAHLRPALPLTAISRRAPLKGLDTTANAGR